MKKLRKEKLELEAKLRKEKDDQLEQQRIQMRGEVEATNASCQQKLQQKQQESDKIRTDLLEEIKCLRAEKDAELQVLSVSKDAEIESLNQSTTATITELKRKCLTIMETSQSQLHSFKKEKDSEFESMKLQLNTELANKQKIFDIEQKGSADAMEALETTKSKEIDSLNSTANKNLSELRAERAAEVDKLSKKITDLEQSNSELSSQISVQTDKDELIKALQERSDDHENTRQELQKQMETTCNEYTVQCAESKATQDAVCEDHARKQAELDQVKEESASKRDIIHDLEIQNQDLVNNIATLEQLCCMKEDMHIILDQNDKQTASLRNMKDQLLQELNSSSEYIITQSEKSLEENRHYNKMKEVLEDRHYEIEALKQLVVQLRSRRPIYQVAKDDIVDKTLGEYINTREEPLMVPLIREDREIYTFGTKRIFIKLEQGKIIIRVGGGFMQLEEFLEIYTPIELEKQENRLADVHPKAKKVMGKLVSNQLHSNTPMSPQKAANILKKSVEAGGLKTAYTSAYAVRRPSPTRPNARSPTQD